MDFYNLELDEAIIMQASNVSRDGYDEREFEDEYLQEILLTNKNIIYVVSDDPDAENEDLYAITVPLSAVKVIDSQVQVRQVEYGPYGLCLQIQFVHGVEYWRFGIKPKKQIPRWVTEISNAVLTATKVGSEYKHIPQQQSQTTTLEDDDFQTKPTNFSNPCLCVNCGAKMQRTAKFCSECGAKTDQTVASIGEEYPVVYDGKLHKCRNCGTMLNSFETSCPICSYELRDTHASAAIRAFAEKMEQLQQNGKYKDKNNIINLIRTFPIPNTREDLLEFLILAKSNIREDRYSSDLPKYRREISDAWNAKFEQAYHKMLVAFPDDPEVKYFAQIYAAQKKETRKMRARRASKRIGKNVAAFFLIVCAVMVAIFAPGDGTSGTLLAIMISTRAMFMFLGFGFSDDI